jgi:hypothetical protein
VVAVSYLGGSILLTGDFNARTSVADDYVDCRYFADHMPDTLPLGNDFPKVLLERHNSDKGGLKGWHNEFLDLCSSSGLFIFNGRIIGDELGECTCFANGSSSLVDDMVASPALFDCATSLVVHKCPLLCGKGGDLTTCHFHSNCSYLGNMCHQQLQNHVQTSVISNMMLISAHNIVNTYSNRLPSAQHR